MNIVTIQKRSCIIVLLKKTFGVIHIMASGHGPLWHRLLWQPEPRHQAVYSMPQSKTCCTSTVHGHYSQVIIISFSCFFSLQQYTWALGWGFYKVLKNGTKCFRHREKWQCNVLSVLVVFIHQMSKFYVFYCSSLCACCWLDRVLLTS